MFMLPVYITQSQSTFAYSVAIFWYFACKSPGTPSIMTNGGSDLQKENKIPDISGYTCTYSIKYILITNRNEYLYTHQE
jgi:hypothetical protein